jgi:hypothetical protein
VDGSAVVVEAESYGVLVRAVWSLCELGGDGAGGGMGSWSAFSDYRRGTSRAGMARDICYSDVYVSGAGDCGVGGAGAVGIAAGRDRKASRAVSGEINLPLRHGENKTSYR